MPGSARRPDHADGCARRGRWFPSDRLQGCSQPAAQWRRPSGNSPGTLDANNVGAAVAELTTQCDEAGNGYELVTQLQAVDRTQKTSGFVVSYLSEGQERELTVPFTVVLCNASDAVACK